MRNINKILAGKHEGTLLRDQGTGGMVILKRILEKEGMTLWAGSDSGQYPVGVKHDNEPSEPYGSIKGEFLANSPTNELKSMQIPYLQS
jgi:hypothetical protein